MLHANGAKDVTNVVLPSRLPFSGGESSRHGISECETIQRANSGLLCITLLNHSGIYTVHFANLLFYLPAVYMYKYYILTTFTVIIQAGLCIRYTEMCSVWRMLCWGITLSYGFLYHAAVTTQIRILFT